MSELARPPVVEGAWEVCLQILDHIRSPCPAHVGYAINAATRGAATVVALRLVQRMSAVRTIPSAECGLSLLVAWRGQGRRRAAAALLQRLLLRRVEWSKEVQGEAVQLLPLDAVAARAQLAPQGLERELALVALGKGGLWASALNLIASCERSAAEVTNPDALSAP
eukprot:Hpha_TRINITY_DN7912_c0_g1::TRINITY_DN7912_c0_g1_i1::g.146128::m.146128